MKDYESRDGAVVHSFSTASANIVPPGTIRKKIDKKLRYFRLSPNFAHRKYIDLPNQLSSFTPYKVLVTTRLIWNFVTVRDPVSLPAELQVIWPIKHGIICREKLIQNWTK